MRITKKQLEAKVNSYNDIADIIKLKLNGDSVETISLYTEDNNRIATANMEEIDMLLDALINLKTIENIEEIKMRH